MESSAETELRQLVGSAVESLDEPFRSAIIDCHLRGKSSSEVAAAAGVAPATIRTRVHRVMGMLRRKLDAEYGGDRRFWTCIALASARLTDTNAAAIGGTIVTKKTLAAVLAAAILIMAGIWGLLQLDAVGDSVLEENETAGVTEAVSPRRLNAEPERGSQASLQSAPEVSSGTTQDSGAALKGTVFLPDKQVAPGAFVGIYRKIKADWTNWDAFDRAESAYAPRIPVLETRADSSGRFAFQTVPDGSLEIIAKAPGYMRSRSRELDGASTADLVLRACKSVTGIAVDENGQPIAGAEVAIHSNDNNLNSTVPFVETTRTNSKGEFPLLLPGRRFPAMAIHLRATGFAEKAFEQLEKLPEDAAGRMVFKVERGRKLSLTFVSQRGSLTENLEFMVRVQGSGFTKTDTSVSGEAVMDAFPETEALWILLHSRDWVIVPTHEGQLSKPTGSMYASPVAALRFRVPKAGDVHLNVNIARGGQLKGRLLDRDTGLGVEGVSILASPGLEQCASRRHLSKMKTDSSGEFLLTGLQLPHAWIRLDSREWLLAEPLEHLTGSDPENGLFWGWFRKSIALDRPHAPLQIKVVRSAGVSGIVNDPEGNPVPDAVIRLPSDQSGYLKKLWTRSDAQGRFNFEALYPSSSFQLSVRHKEFDQKTTEAIALLPGASRNIEITLRQGKRTTIAVQDENGSGVEGARIIVRNGVKTTNRSGEAHFFGLAGRKSILQVEAPGDLALPRDHQHIREFPDEETRVIVTLVKPQIFRGTIRDENGKPLHRARIYIAPPALTEFDKARLIKMVEDGEIPMVDFSTPEGKQVALFNCSALAFTKKDGSFELKISDKRDWRLFAIKTTRKGLDHESSLIDVDWHPVIPVTLQPGIDQVITVKKD